MPPAETSRAASDRDASDLGRSLRINLVGYAIKFAYPCLLILVIRQYGAGPYGVFAVVQAILSVFVRFGLFGLDRTLLWWIPRQAPADERDGLRATLVLVATSSTVLALLTAFVLTPVIAGWAGRTDIIPSMRWMAAGLLPMAILEVLTAAAVGKRHLEAHILYKEGLQSLVLVVVALVCHAAGLGAVGLEVAFVVSYLAALAGVLGVFRRAFAGSRWTGPLLRVPPAMWRYSWPMWLNESAGYLLLRLDLLILAALTDDVAVGIYAGAVQYAQNVMAVRWSFDPMMVAVISQIGHVRDNERLRRGFAHAWHLVAMIQLPLMAFMIAAAAWIMPLLGKGYGDSVGPALVLVALYAVHGLFGLNQHIVSGFGHSRLTLINTLASIAAAACLLVALIPPLRVMGAALGMGLMYVALNALWVIEARVVVGEWHYARSIGRTLLLAVAAGAVMGGVWFAAAAVLGEGSAADLGARIAGLAGFAAVFVPGMLRQGGWRTTVSRPDDAPAPGS